MNAEILHWGFDGLKFSIQADIPPALREELANAKAHARETGADCDLILGTIALTVGKSGGMGFTGKTGDMGAVWLFQDPENRIRNNPGIQVDFRAMGLAVGGLEGAEAHFRDCMAAFGIPYAEAQLRVSRVDFAVDILAPWFEPSRDALVMPPGTNVEERTEGSETHASGVRVTGLRAGAIANRQIAIYDKRLEVIQQHKPFWLLKWNAALKAAGKPPLNTADAEKSRVWRFEIRLGSKQLRNRFAMRNWNDLRSMVGDVFRDVLRRVHYCTPTRDSNRSRWPTHPLWRLVEDVIYNDLSQHCAGVLPSDVIEANRVSKCRELDAQILGLLTTRAAISGVKAPEFEAFVDQHLDALIRLSRDHVRPLHERIARAEGRYGLR